MIQHSLVDFTQRDGQRLFLILRLNKRTDELETTLISLLEVAVNLAGAFRSENHQSILGGHFIQQLINGRGGDTNGIIEHRFGDGNIVAHAVDVGHVGHKHLFESYDK